jgi:superfamily II DNA or RNA helicase
MQNNLSIKEVLLKRTYSSLEVDLFEDVVVPLLKTSVHYDRGVGFFTSGWLKEASNGLIAFVKNSGKARIVTSPHLSESDWKIIKEAEEERQDNLIVSTSIERAFKELEDKFESNTLAVLAWLIRDGILEFRFAIPRKQLEGGDFHSKIALFVDANGDGVALHGSQNDSVKASMNEESFSTFCSWDEGGEWYQEHQDRFNKIWDGNYENLRMVKVSEAEKEIIFRYTEKYPRPYNNPNQTKRAVGPSHRKKIELRRYQSEAISEWEKAGRRGIFEMATGTGKTITAISAAVNVFQVEGRLALVVLVPYIHLVDQWVEELTEFGFDPIRCYESSSTWKKKVSSRILEFNAKLTNHLCLVSTHQTSSMPTFGKTLSRLHKPYLLLGDEIHELGATNYRKGLSEDASWRIGLSATPDRWYDEEGTKVLRNYFGNTVVKYELKKAIKEKALTPYHYYPEKIDLNEEEIEEYIRLSKLIAQLSGKKDDDNSRIENLMRKRADVIGKASNKIPHLINIVQKHKKECERTGEKFQHVLFYCNKGTHREVLKAVDEMGLRVHEFVHDVTLKERSEVLSAFTKGDIDGLVAIRCLDQGVDVPATRRAYILASSTNPREFVQRRGRILRKSSGKHYAIVHDFLVGPWETAECFGREAAKNLLLRELPRFAEFSLDARNSQEARDAIWDKVVELDLVPYLRKRPWDVYRELQAKAELL